MYKPRKYIFYCTYLLGPRSPTNIAAVFLPSIPMAAQSKAWVCGRTFLEFASSSPEEAMDVCRL